MVVKWVWNWSANRFAGRQTPQPGRPIRAGRGEQSSVGAKGKRLDVVGMPDQRRYPASVPRIQHANDMIGLDRHQPLAIARELGPGPIGGNP